MQRLNRVLRVQNVMLKCSQQQQSGLRTNSLSRVLVVSRDALSSSSLSNRGVVADSIRMIQPQQFSLATKRFYASSNLPEHTRILLPALSPTMEQGIMTPLKTET